MNQRPLGPEMPKVCLHRFRWALKTCNCLQILRVRCRLLLIGSQKMHPIRNFLLLGCYHKIAVQTFARASCSGWRRWPSCWGSVALPSTDWSSAASCRLFALGTEFGSTSGAERPPSRSCARTRVSVIAVRVIRSYADSVCSNAAIVARSQAKTATERETTNRPVRATAISEPSFKLAS